MAESFDSFELADMPDLPQPEDPARLMALAHHGMATDLNALIADRMARLKGDWANAAMLMDMALALQFYGLRDSALVYQRHALATSRIYAHPSSRPEALRMLLLVAPGDLQANMPIELILPGREVSLFKLYVIPNEALPTRIPNHDLAMVAISESDGTSPPTIILAG